MIPTEMDKYWRNVWVEVERSVNAKSDCFLRHTNLTNNR
jgi:hypothetical protein